MATGRFIRKLFLSCLLGGHVAACGGETDHEREHDEGNTGPAIDRTFESGSRLRARILRAPDGTTLSQGWFDNELQTNCTFERAADGEFRCLPQDGTVTLFTDTTCSAFAVGQYTWTWIESSGVCPDWTSSSARAGVWRRTERLSGELYDNLGGQCAPANACRTEQPRYAVEPREEMPYESFVRADHVVEGRSDRVGADVLVAEDGARQVRGARDLTSDSPCSAGFGGDNRCTPQNYAHATIFPDGHPWRARDSSCSEPVANGNTPGCAASVLTVLYEQSDVCGESRASLHEVGAQVETIYHVDSAGACVEYANSLGELHYEIGPEITLDRFGTLERVTAGDGPLRIGYNVASPSEEPVGPSSFEDENAEYVSIVRLPDGKLHAIGENVSLHFRSIFFDDACTRDAILLAPSSCSTEPLDPGLVSIEDECRNNSVHPLIATAEMPRFQMTNEGCAPFDPGDTPGLQAFEIGDALDPGEFPVLEELVQ